MSILPNISKIYERLLFKQMAEYFHLSQNTSVVSGKVARLNTSVRLYQKMEGNLFLIIRLFLT